MTTKDANNPELSEDASLCGYQVQRIIELPEIQSIFYELVHSRTRARHIHISNQDKENSFSVALKTVPWDSTGVAHILEHTVLCGSVHYPVRDPFFSMMKRSLSTFMNALTASDWTMYPFCTQNRKDFYNLLGVYLDSVFFPRLDRLSFKQEGHRLEFEPDPQQPDKQRLTYKGVVYNEMKGALSSPDQVMARSILHALYPDTTYSCNSGGNPMEIPDLTHEQLLAFHRRHYHPSNAYFYTYGNFPLKDHLAFIDETILRHFSAIDPETEVPSQPRWDTPGTADYTYPIEAAEDDGRKCQICLAWLTADIRESFEILVLTILEQVLLGNPGSPLRKALLDSEIGSTLSDGTGFDPENKDSMFACGLKDVAADAGEAIERLIFDTLHRIVEEGIDERLVESAIHQIEFHRKEVTNSPFPYGLKLLLRFSGDWFHDGDPALALQFDSLLEKLQQKRKEPGFLEAKIRQYLIDNPHRVRLRLSPDPEQAERENRMIAEKLRAVEKELTQEDLESIQKDTQRLIELQESEEDLSCLPTLEREDIPPLVVSVPAREERREPPAVFYEQPTVGILYFSAVMDLESLPEDLLPLLPFFCYCFTRMGTRQHDPSDISQLIDLYTGGMSLSINAGSRFAEPQEPSCLSVMTFNSKCLSRNTGNMFGLAADLLTSVAFSDTELLKRLLMEYRAEMESAVVANGHRYAISLAARGFTLSAALNEKWHGIHQLETIKKITAELSGGRLNAIAEQMHQIRDILFTGGKIKTALIGEKADLDEAAGHVDTLCQKLGKTWAGSFHPPAYLRLPEEMPREGWSTSSAVSFVARVFPAVRMDHPDAPVLAVISKALRSMFLHREIREKGGAYGGFAAYQPETGLFYFGSYRDPQIINTLKVYEAAAEFITSGDYSDENVKEAILQVCADIDRPDPPGPAAAKDFYRRLINLSDETRRRFKERLVQLDKQTVLETAQTYFGPKKSAAAVAVISNKTELEKANQQLRENPLELHRI
ncbi:MAG: insulinase family protein [Desulfosalsimonadaceae bacterium]